MIELPEYLVECAECNSRTLAVPMTETREDFREDPFEDYWHVVVQCKICYSAMLIRHDKKPGYGGAHRAVVLWPNSGREMSSKIPESLRLEHKEARTCFNGSAYTATVVMVRRTLEGVCAENGFKAALLFKSLEQMRKNGIIEGRLLEWAEGLRVLGNDGAHFTGKRVSREDAQDALALAEALLDYLYVFSAQFDEFKQRRQLGIRTTDEGNAAAGIADTGG